MFRSLNEEIKRTEGESMSVTARLLQYAGVFIVSMFAFGALYAGIVLFE